MYLKIILLTSDMCTIFCGKHPTQILKSLTLIFCNIVIRYNQTVGRLSLSKADVRLEEVFLGRTVLAAAAVYLG